MTHAYPQSSTRSPPKARGRALLSAPDLGQSRAWDLILAALLAFGWLLDRTPPWTYFLGDPDGGMFMYGATHLLATGAQPQVDVLSSYGPMSFYVRAALQSVLGQRLIAEMAVAWIGYTLAYVLLFGLVRRISASRRFAFFTLLLALVCIPRYYKFFVVLMPVLTATAGAAYIARPRPWRAGALGVSVGLALLFRHDFGAYCLLGALAAWWLGSRPGTRLANGAWMLGGLILAVGCWAVPVAGLGLLLPLLRDLSALTLGQGAGLALPHPLRTWVPASTAMLFLTVYSLPALAGALLVGLRDRLAPADKALGWMLVLLAAATLGQSMHRADIPHLLQVMAPTYLVLALCWRLYAQLRLAPAWRAMVQGGTLLWVVVPVAAVAWPGGWLPRYDLSVVAQRLRDGWLTPAALRTRIPAEAPGDPAGAAVLAAVEMTAPGERIAVFPFAPQVYFFSERTMAGDTLAIAPGYLDQPYFQERIIASLRRDRPRLVLWDTGLAYDGLPQRNAVLTHAEVYRFVTDAYQPVGEAGPFTLFAPRPADP